MLVGGGAGAWATREARGRLHRPPAPTARPVAGFVRDLRDVFRSRSFVTLFVAVLAFFVAQGMAGALAIHLNRYFWRLSSSGVQLVLMGATLGPLMGAPIAAWLSRRIEKKTLAISGFVVFAFAQMLPPLLRIAGLMMIEGQLLAAFLFVSALLGGIGLVGAAIGGQSMMADATDEHELKLGVRREALFFSGFMLAQKAASGLGGFFAGLALDVIHFPARADEAALSAGLIRNLALVAGPVPAIITLVAPLVLIGFRLSRERHAEILVNLETGR